MNESGLKECRGFFEKFSVGFLFSLLLVQEQKDKVKEGVYVRVCTCIYIYKLLL